VIGSVRHEVRIARGPDEVWALAGDPARLHEWFPGIVACTVDGTTRTITTATGIRMPEEILVIDAVARRFVYRITGPLVRHHRGTIDVIDLGDGGSLAVYSTEADPRTMALMIGGAAGSALDELRRRLDPPVAGTAPGPPPAAAAAG